jgi:importin-4
MLRIAMEPDDDDDDPSNDTPWRLAIINIDILSTSLPPTHVVEPLLKEFPNLSQSGDPNHRRAAMAAIGAVMEGALEYLAPHIESVILPRINVGLQDDSPMVMRAALVALSQITEELPQNVMRLHGELFPRVFNIVSHARDFKIMKAACATLDAMLEWIPQEAIVNYLPELMSTLLLMLQNLPEPELKLISAGISL